MGMVEKKGVTDRTVGWEIVTALLQTPKFVTTEQTGSPTEPVAKGFSVALRLSGEKAVF
jgi:hypothetical protein